MPATLSMFEEAGVEVKEPEPTTEVKLGRWKLNVNLHKKRRQALKEFREVLAELEGKDIYISASPSGPQFYLLEDLKLGCMRTEVPWFCDKEVPNTIILRGNRGGDVRIFTERVYALRRQEYMGYTLWLLDFWNGWGEYPIDRYHHPGYDCLQIKRFND